MDGKGTCKAMFRACLIPGKDSLTDWMQFSIATHTGEQFRAISVLCLQFPSLGFRQTSVNNNMAVIFTFEWNPLKTSSRTMPWTNSEYKAL